MTTDEQKDFPSGEADLSDLLGDVLGLVGDIIGTPLTAEEIARRREAVEQVADNLPRIESRTARVPREQVQYPTVAPARARPHAASVREAIAWWDVQDEFYADAVARSWTSVGRYKLTDDIKPEDDRRALTVRHAAEVAANAIVAEAEADARYIRREAREEAGRILRDARRQVDASGPDARGLEPPLRG